MIFFEDINVEIVSKYPGFVEAVNGFAKLSSSLQYGMNLITNSMNSFHTIDAAYAGTIDDPTVLSKFVESSIDANIPSKYIAWNVYAVSSDKLRGSADQSNPKMGQSRIVLFPADSNVVVKIALNQLGIRANNTEYMITEKLKSVHKDEYIAKIMNVYGNKSVVEAEKAPKPEGVINNIHNITSGLACLINAEISNLGLDIRVGDIHSENIGVIRDHFVVTDYGSISRTVK